MAPSRIWTRTMTRKLPVPSRLNAGMVSRMNSTEAEMRTFLRPKRSESMPVRKMKPM
jgi:hypothetical protein